MHTHTLHVCTSSQGYRYQRRKPHNPIKREGSTRAQWSRGSFATSYRMSAQGLIQLLSANLLSFSQVKPKRRACARGSNRTPCSHSRSAHVRSRRARAVRAKCSRPCSSALITPAKNRGRGRALQHMHKKDAAPHDATGNARMLSSIISVCTMPD